MLVTSDKDGADSVFESLKLVDADIVISAVFGPYTVLRANCQGAKVRLAVMRWNWLDDVDLAGCRFNYCITVTEVMYWNSISVAEHVVMMILSLARNDFSTSGGL